MRYAFRRNTRHKWMRCHKTAILRKGDYFATNPNDITNLQVFAIKGVIGGEEFIIEPEDIRFKENHMFYETYLFRQKYPNPPDEKQLMNVLLKGNDSIINKIILKTDGLFCLFQENQCLEYGSNPEVVVQFEGFHPSNGNVGQAIINNGIKNYVQNIFKVSIYHWLNHLKFKKLHEYADINMQDIDQVPETIDLFNELLQIQKTWESDY
jgi:hypothetical protein